MTVCHLRETAHGGGLHNVTLYDDLYLNHFLITFLMTF